MNYYPNSLTFVQNLNPKHMKRYLAYLLGAASILCSCDKQNPDNYASKDSETELRSIIADLQKEVASLKEEIYDLKTQSGNGQSVDLSGIESDILSIKTDIKDLQDNQFDGMFEVDGLWFSKSGFVMSQPKTYVFTTTEYTMPNEEYSYEVALDEFGRLKTSKRFFKRTGGGLMHYDVGIIDETTYEYNGKTVKTTVSKSTGTTNDPYLSSITETTETTYF